MKIHVYSAKKANKLFYALTRDKSGKALTNLISLPGKDDAIFNKGDWRYREVISLDFGDQSGVIQTIKNDLNKNNVCVIEVKKFPHKIYVYDIKYDILDARLYSLDEDLSRFHHHQNTMELSPMGDFLGYGSLSFIGTLDNHHAFDLMRMGIGISDLVSNGFFVSISDNDIHQNEVLRRRLERKIRKDLLKKAGALGINVISFRINELSVKENDDKVWLN
jgi:hypothetical protein